jgi:hypothetical protein
MDVLFLIEGASYEKVRRILLGDETISRASMTFRDAGLMGKEGYYCLVSGTEEACSEALRIARIINSFAGRGVMREVKGDEREEVVRKLQEESARAIEGLGDIFR